MTFQDGLGDPPLLSPLASVRALGANAGPGALPSLEALGVPDLGPHLAAVGVTAANVADLLPGLNPRFLRNSGPAPAPAPAAAPVAAASATSEPVPAPAPPVRDARSVLPFVGGESAALARVEHYVWTTTAVRTYKDTRNGLLGADYSTKLSPWLAFGCISPRTVAAEVRAHEARAGANDSTYWVLFELLWRDYFRFACLAWGPRLFWLWGPRQEPDRSRPWRRDAVYRDAWCLGRTGYPFVDANMRELLLTGFMSNRGRQNVASFFTRDLQMDWRIGAEWFESLLIDHDPGSNYGNWTYVAGVGADPREDRYFSIPKQSRDYDRDGAYMRTWLPELARASPDALHEPHRLPTTFRPAYPAPIVGLRGAARAGPPAGAGAGAGRGGLGGGRGGGGGGRGGGGGGGGGGGAGGPVKFGPLDAAFARQQRPPPQA